MAHGEAGLTEEGHSFRSCLVYAPKRVLRKMGYMLLLLLVEWLKSDDDSLTKALSDAPFSSASFVSPSFNVRSRRREIVTEGELMGLAGLLVRLAACPV